MTGRRSFFKKLGLAATAVAVSAKAETVEQPVPPTPQVKTRQAYVTRIAGHDPVVINHQLNSLLICAVVGDKDGKSRPAVVEALSMVSCKVTVPKPSQSFFSWRKKEQKPVYSLVVYVPA